MNRSTDMCFPRDRLIGARFLALGAAATLASLASMALAAAPQSVGEQAAQGLAQAEGAAQGADGSDAQDSDEEVPGPPPSDGDSDVQVAGPPKASPGNVIPRGVGFNQKGGQLSAMALESAAIGNPEVHYHVMGPGPATPAGYVQAPIVNPQTTQPNWHYHVVSTLGAGSMNTSSDSHWHFYNSSGGAGQVPGAPPEYLGGPGAYGGIASSSWGAWAFGGMGAGNGVFAAYD